MNKNKKKYIKSLIQEVINYTDYEAYFSRGKLETICAYNIWNDKRRYFTYEQFIKWAEKQIGWGSNA